MSKAYQLLLSDLKARKFKPLYLLHGEESFYIDKIMHYFENFVLDEGEKDFNQTVVYGKDSEANAVIEIAKRLPMMADYQLILVKEAQDLRDVDALLPYFERPNSSSILVFAHKHKKVDSRKKSWKTFAQKGVVFEAKKLYDSEIPNWIEHMLEEKKLIGSPKVIALIAEHLGNDLSKIENEIEKLSINLPEGSKITPDHIQEHIGLSKDFNVFELQAAIANKNKEKAFQIINYFNSNSKNHPGIVTIISLYGFFSKLLKLHQNPGTNQYEVAKIIGVNAFFARDYIAAKQNYNLKKTIKAIEQLNIFDLKLKGVNNNLMPESDLMKELLIKIMY